MYFKSEIHSNIGNNCYFSISEAENFRTCIKMKYYSLLSLHPALSQDYLFSSPSTFSANFLIPEYKLQKHHEGTDWTKRLQLRSLSATTSFFLKDTHRDMKWNKAIQFYNLNSIQSALITRKRKQFHFNDCTVDWHIFLGKKRDRGWEKERGFSPFCFK